jgi:hypothetical protein
MMSHATPAQRRSARSTPRSRTIEISGRYSRCVLPREALHDAVSELVAADGMAFAALAPLVGLVHDWVAAAPAEAEAHVELTLAP